MKVAIIFGSLSDTPVMKKAALVLRELEVEYAALVLSAHRTPELLQETVKNLEDHGTEVIIAGAGLAAHLPGLIASLTLIPVIGVPINSGGLGGMDALLSMVQMPRPIPVAVVGVDNGANAAYLACQVLSLKYPDVQKRLAAFRAKLKADCAGKAERVEL
ncbi:MAG: 5-(carboxyamino)imidazole ribonucleotide mutase [Treponema sp.]|jgi:5-(carboxyamino)imidazole ribonucleotide mutase|nr:5-(carboxyamino)imidazole ribonucleotide mutase [Treponema sp.]